MLEEKGGTLRRLQGPRIDKMLAAGWESAYSRPSELSAVLLLQRRLVTFFPCKTLRAGFFFFLGLLLFRLCLIFFYVHRAEKISSRGR